MADGTAHSRYVKLTKDQAPAEDIKPGELNRPIEVPQLNVHRCHECGQPSPESYQPLEMSLGQPEFLAVLKIEKVA
ncbi:hypothetical protein ACFXTO_013712 [Malus domestica]